MVAKTFEHYIESLKVAESQYQWPLEGLDSILKKRADIRKQYPYFVTYPGHYEGGLIDILEEWCREHYGARAGECYWEECPVGWEFWYYSNKFDEELDKELSRKLALPDDHPDRTKDIIEEHYEKYKNHLNAPPYEHSHTGIWTTQFLMKTDYDYGYQDFYFQDPSHALHFKMVWDVEAFK